MIRTSRWKVNLYQTRLSQADRGVKLPRQKWSQLASKHWWWPWLAHNGLFLWANQQWLGWSHNCHLSNRLKLVIPWQNPLKGLSINELVSARTAGYHRACVWLSLNPSIRHSLWHKTQYLFEGLAISISGQRDSWFYQCQNVLPEGCRGVNW